MDPIDIVSLVIAVIATLFAWPTFEEWLEKRKRSKQPAAGHLLNAIQTRKVLRVGLLEYPPLSDFSEANQKITPTGIYNDIILRLCELHGLAAQFEVLPISQAIPSLASSKIDVFSCIFKTPRRANEIDFTGFLHFISATGVCRSDFDKVTNPGDLRNPSIRIVICRGEIGHEILIDDLGLSESDKRITVLDVDDVSDAVSWLATGKADVAVADSLSIQRFLMEDISGAYKALFTDHPLYVASCGYAIRKGEGEFCGWLNTEILRIAAMPEFQEAARAAIAPYSRVIRAIHQAYWDRTPHR